MNFLSDSYNYYMFTQTLNFSAIKKNTFTTFAMDTGHFQPLNSPASAYVLITTNITKKYRQRYHSDSFDEYHTLHV